MSLWLLTCMGLARATRRPWSTHSWMERWKFTPQDLGGFTYAKLALISVCGLYLELMMIGLGFFGRSASSRTSRISS